MTDKNTSRHKLCWWEAWWSNNYWLLLIHDVNYIRKLY